MNSIDDVEDELEMVEEIVEIDVDPEAAQSVWPMRLKGVARTNTAKAVRIAAQGPKDSDEQEGRRVCRAAGGTSHGEQGDDGFGKIDGDRNDGSNETMGVRRTDVLWHPFVPLSIWCWSVDRTHALPWQKCRISSCCSLSPQCSGRSLERSCV